MNPEFCKFHTTANNSSSLIEFFISVSFTYQLSYGIGFDFLHFVFAKCDPQSVCTSIGRYYVVFIFCVVCLRSTSVLSFRSLLPVRFLNSTFHFSSELFGVDLFFPKDSVGNLSFIGLLRELISALLYFLWVQF